MSKKLSTKIQFNIDNLEDLPPLTMDVKINKFVKKKGIKIVEHKLKKKNIDVSTKLF